MVPKEIEVPAAIFCPVCGSSQLQFCGLRAGLFVRGHFNWVAPFMCNRTHTFFLSFAEGGEQSKFIQKERIDRGRPVQPLSLLVARCRAEQERAQRLCAEARQRCLSLATRWGEPKSRTVQ